MAFDLLHYFTQQTIIQKPELFSDQAVKDKKGNLLELNALVLGQLVQLARQDDQNLYQEILAQRPEFVDHIAKPLVNPAQAHFNSDKSEIASAIEAISALQLSELMQLEQTGNFGQDGMRELILNQTEHLSGQASDWVWSANQLTELVGSKPVAKSEEINLDETMKEFNQMVHQAQPVDSHEAELAVHDSHQPEQVYVQATPTPKWAYVVAPFVALFILIFLYYAYGQLV